MLTHGEEYNITDTKTQQTLNMLGGEVGFSDFLQVFP